MDEGMISQVSPISIGPATPSAPGPKRFLLPIIIVLVLLGAIFAGAKYLQSRNEAIPAPTPLPTQAPTETPTPTIEPTATPKATPTKKPTPTPTKTATSSATTSKGLIVRVLNGTTTSGLAAALIEYLVGLGYDSGGTGNADRQDYDKATITIKASKESLLSTLKTDVATKYSIGTTSATLASTESYDALVIIGKN